MRDNIDIVNGEWDIAIRSDSFSALASMKVMNT